MTMRLWSKLGALYGFTKLPVALPH